MLQNPHNQYIRNTKQDTLKLIHDFAIRGCRTVNSTQLETIFSVVVISVSWRNVWKYDSDLIERELKLLSMSVNPITLTRKLMSSTEGVDAAICLIMVMSLACRSSSFHSGS
ncbi:hypothetical protein WICPIJ_007957 [Wickerhamomyces pijperi]|uniref:Uncharacterized protein n=1 Tax=Wickerhamomyces pijperi TaxID=599730 RepID=A0A9P8PZL0_WICPI|nr:hypothetical protein WICPIJ_007957 [Wickerhamomyces pijperi]